MTPPTGLTTIGAMELRDFGPSGLQLQGLHLRPDGGGVPGRFRRLMRRIEQLEALDPAVRAVEPPAGRLVRNRRLRSFLHGDATGIPLHGILTDAPFGAWFMAMYLDLYSDPGTQRAATRLVGLGVLAAAPTALTGWAEWALAGRGTKRVGIVHAGLNGAAVLIFPGSWAARLRGRRKLGVGLARVGALVLVASALLGGYMGSARRGA